MKRTAFLTAFALTAATMTWAGEKLEIIKAEYGAQNKWTDVTATVQAKVANDTLTIEANNNLCQDPAPGLPKTLKITAKAGAQKADFRCEERSSIEINAEKVAIAAKKQVNATVVVSAIYGAGTKTADVTDKVKDMVADGQKKISASNTLFGDPAEGEAKTLTVKIKVDGKESTLSANENEDLVLP